MKKNTDSYDERMKRFWHYWNMKNATEEMIETSSGELRIIIDALADYHDIIQKNVETMGDYAKATWINRAERIKQIQTKLEESIGYSRDKQIEVCQKKKSKKPVSLKEEKQNNKVSQRVFEKFNELLEEGK